MDAAQEKLVRDHVEYVRALAGQLARSLPARVDHEELVAFGLHGLTEAATRYDANRGATFKTFSYYRIRGAMYDGLRSSGWLARSEHLKVKLLERADDVLEHAAAVPGGPPPAAVDAARQLSELLADVTAVFVTSIDTFESIESDPQAQGGAGAIMDGLLAAQASSAVHRALEALPDKERELLRKHYYEDQTLEDAGRTLGMSKSWASRLHARAIRRLRLLLEEATGGSALR